MARRCLRPLSTLFLDAVFTMRAGSLQERSCFLVSRIWTCWKNHRIFLAIKLNFAGI
jgi:hypothetical protein